MKEIIAESKPNKLLYFFLLITFNLSTAPYAIDGSLLVKKENYGLVAGIQKNWSSSLYNIDFLIGGFYNFQKATVLLYFHRTSQLSIFLGNTDSYIRPVLSCGINKNKSAYFSIGAQICYPITEYLHIAIAGNITTHRYNHDHSMQKFHGKKNKDQTNPTNSIVHEKPSKTYNLYKNPDNLELFFPEDKQEFNEKKTINSYSRTIENQLLCKSLINNDIPAKEIFKKICFFHFFNEVYDDLITYISGNISDPNKAGTTVRNFFKKFIDETTESIWILKNKQKLNNNEKQIMQEQLTDLFLPIMTLNASKIEKFAKFLLEDAHIANHRKYIEQQNRPMFPYQINRKINGINFKITNLHSNYTHTADNKYSKIFSYPTFESSENKFDKNKLKTLLRIKPPEEYAKITSVYNSYANIEDKIKKLSLRDNNFNSNVILKEAVLDFTPEIMYVYGNVDHVILVLETKNDITTYDSNCITIPTYCNNLGVQTGPNCCAFALFFSILTKLFENVESAIKISVAMNQMYNNENITGIEKYVLNILSFNKITEKEKEHTVRFCKNLINSHKLIKNNEFLVKKYFGDLLRNQLITANIVSFINIQANIEEIKKNIINEVGIATRVAKVFSRKKMALYIQKDWDSFTNDLQYFTSKFKKLLYTDTKNEAECMKIYKEIFEAPQNCIKYHFLADQLLFSFRPTKQEDAQIIFLNPSDNEEQAFKTTEKIFFLLDENFNFIIKTNTLHEVVMKIGNRFHVEKVYIKKSDMPLLNLILILLNERQNIQETLKIIQTLMDNIYSADTSMAIKGTLNNKNQNFIPADIQKKAKIETKNTLEISENKKTLLASLANDATSVEELQRLDNSEYMLKQILNCKINDEDWNFFNEETFNRLEHLLQIPAISALEILENVFKIDNIFNNFIYTNDSRQNYKELSIISLYRYIHFFQNDDNKKILPLLPIHREKDVTWLNLFTSNFDYKVILPCLDRQKKNLKIIFAKKQHKTILRLDEAINLRGFQYKLPIGDNKEAHIILGLSILFFYSKTMNILHSFELILFFIQNNSKCEAIIDQLLNSSVKIKFKISLKKNQVSEKQFIMFCEKIKNILIKKELI